MDFVAGQGATTSHSRSYGEELQRGPAAKDAVLCSVICAALHYPPVTGGKNATSSPSFTGSPGCA